jgi:hypothetical protein
MSKKMASIIMGYGLLLAVLGLAVRAVTPEKGTSAFIVGITGGGLCLLCGIAAWTGHRRRIWTVLTGMAVALILLTQTVQAWFPSADKSGSVAGAWLLTFMLLLTVGLLMYALLGERPQEYYSQETPRRDNAPSRESASIE